MKLSMNALTKIEFKALAACALACTVATFAHAQDGTKLPPTTKEDKPAVKQDKAPIEYLSAWPKPADKDQVLTDIERVIKAHTPEMGTQGRDALIAAGAAAVPFVLERYGREKDEEVQDRLHEVLMGITGPEQTRLLAKQFSSKLLPERTFALWRAAAFPDPEIQKDAVAALARVTKQGDKADEAERYAAALCAASTGSTAGFDTLIDAANKKWDKKKRELRTAVEATRGTEASELIFAKLGKLDPSDRKGKVAMLRMLAGCGTKEHAQRLRGYLDDDDNSIRVAAINALRGMVDGELPLEDISAFEAIETAKKWKSKL